MLHTQEVTGSSPVAPTIRSNHLSRPELALKPTRNEQGSFDGTLRWGGRRHSGTINPVNGYRSRDAIAVRAGEAIESAIVAQLVPAAEIH